MTTKFHKVSEYEWMKRIPEGAPGYVWEELYDGIILPQRKTRHSSGYDFHAPYAFSLAPEESIVIETGIKIELNPNQELLIFPRSGLGFKYFSRLANTIGKIDSDYFNNRDNEGHIMIKIRNEGEEIMDIDKGQAFAQGTIYEYCIVDEDSFEEGDIRAGGFGSTD